jgi:nicotinate phosphoribosyltransferase
MAFESEREAFAELQKLLGDNTVQLIDTYDAAGGARAVARLGKPLWGVRIDSGDFFRLSVQVRGILDDAGLNDAKIMVSGDLDEIRIAEIVQAGAPIDAFGVGTELATSADAPSMGSIYKLVEIEDQDRRVRYTAKHSPDKTTLPGAKQLFRYPDYDLLALQSECADGAEAMLKPVIIGGRLIEPLPTVQEIRNRVQWPTHLRRLEHSKALESLAAHV